MMVSLDGYVAAAEGSLSLPPPELELHQYFNEIQKQTSANLYGRRMYEVMKYWETADQNPDSPAVEVEFARAWQATPKVVVSTTLTSVGLNAKLVKGNLAEVVRELKAEPGSGTLEVNGPTLAAACSRLGLIDEYRMYTYPIVLGGGLAFFEPGTPLRLELIGTEKLPQRVVLTRYRPVAG